MTDHLPIPYPERNLSLSSGEEHADEARLRNLICYIGRMMHEAGYIGGTAGNISARLDESHILVTPSGLAKGFLRPEQVILAGLDDDTFSDPGPYFEGELQLHRECYRQRPDINSVVHAHPPTAVALTIAGISMRTCVVPEAVIVLGLVPTAAYSLPASQEARDAVRVLIAQHDAILLAYHGSVTVAADLWQAYLRLEMVEHTAEVLHRAMQLGPIVPLPPEAVAHLLETRRKLGYWRPGDEERFCEMCGVC